MSLKGIVVPHVSRRTLLQGGAAATALAAASPLLHADQKTPAGAASVAPRKGNIHQSVCRGPYRTMTLDELCAYGAQIGLKGIDLLQPQEFEVPRKYGLVCTMGYANLGNIKEALNRPANHAAIEDSLRKTLPLAKAAGVPNLITFSGNRNGMSDEEGAANTIAALNRMKHMVEDANITLCLELLNSKVNHPDYMADHAAWGVQVMKEVNSPHCKLLYDIYHMQIMDGNLISTIKDNIQWIGHFHTGGVPGRGNLNDHQEVQWDGVMRGIVAAGFTGYVAHEFSPQGDPREALLQAVDRCDV